MRLEDRMSRGYDLAKNGLSDDEVIKTAKLDLAEMVVIRALIATEPFRGALRTRLGPTR